MPYQVNIKETQKLKGNVTIGERGPQGAPGPQGERGEPGGSYMREVDLTNNESSISLLSNIFYRITNQHSGVVEVFFGGNEQGFCNEYLGEIMTTEAVALSFPTSVKWLTNDVDVHDNIIILDTFKTYTFSVINGLGVVVVYE